MLRLEIPFNRTGVLLSAILFASLSGLLLEHFSGSTFDYWVHDAALVHQHRQQWNYVSIVVLDDKVPINVGRKQALPLFAKAADRLISAGAKGIFLDARVNKDMDTRMAFAKCIQTSGEAIWTEPQCAISSSGQCTVIGKEPLSMNLETMQKFSIAPYLGDPDLPDFILYDWETAFTIPETGLVARDRLVTKNDPVARWFDLNENHAIFKMASFFQSPDLVRQGLNSVDDEYCDNKNRCRRIRLSKPQFGTQPNASHPIIPISLLASCNTEIAEQTALLAKDRIIIFQLTSPNEATDILVTPMTTALFSPKQMSFGPQYLADSVETLLNNDHPRQPHANVTLALVILLSLISVISAAYLRQYLVWTMALLVFAGLIALCFLNPLIQLWPVTAAMTSFLAGAGQITGIHLLLGFRHGKLNTSYMPKHVRQLLLSLKTNETFQNKRCGAVVLMSDLAGYTTLTGLLKEPEHILNLMNDYLSETSIVLQDKYNGWLESYVGDMVCYYWPYEPGNEQHVHQQALCGALELAELQKQFFASLQQRYSSKINHETLDKMQTIIDAGIGLSTGDVVMGNLGPTHGIGLKKFGILGDPLNLAARIESLTRLFNAEIIVSGTVIAMIDPDQYSLRRLGQMKVKGRTIPETLYAMGSSNDPRCQPSDIKAWQLWLSAIESGQDTDLRCPEVYKKDQETINIWLSRNLLGDDGIWYLDEK